jgi:hypothetical protein
MGPDVDVTRATVKNVKVGVIGDDAAWLTADLVIRAAGMDDVGPFAYTSDPMRITELVVRDGDAWRAASAHFSYPTSDREMRDMIERGWEPDDEPMEGAVEDAEHAALLTSMKSLAGRVAADKAVSVIGSTKGEKALGAAKAKKLLKKWAKLTFTAVGGVRWTEGTGWATAAANVAMTSKKHKTPLYLYVLAIFRSSKEGGWELVSIHFANQLG